MPSWASASSSGCSTRHYLYSTDPLPSTHSLPFTHSPPLHTPPLPRLRSQICSQLVEEAQDMKILTSRYDGKVERVMSNSFGFGGTNACLVFDKYVE